MKKDTTISQDTKDFIKQNAGIIRAAQFNKLFDEASDYLGVKAYYDLISIFVNAKIDVLQYMNYIPENFFTDSDIKNYIVGENIRIIREGAFNLCTKLQTISLPKSLKEIRSYSFYMCTNLFLVKYRGTKEEWKKVKVETIGNNLLFICGIDCIDGLIEYERKNNEWVIEG